MANITHLVRKHHGYKYPCLFFLRSVASFKNRINTHLPGKLPGGRVMDWVSYLDSFQPSDSELSTVANRVSSGGIRPGLQTLLPLCFVPEVFPWDQLRRSSLSHLYGNTLLLKCYLFCRLRLKVWGSNKRWVDECEWILWRGSALQGAQYLCDLCL